jgi:hypothetical protein
MQRRRHPRKWTLILDLPDYKIPDASASDTSRGHNVEDWWAATNDGKAKAYFACHFRDDDPNDPLKKHSPGLAYARESDHIHQPAPIFVPVRFSILT